MSPFSVFLITVSVFMCWNSHPATAAVLATIRSQDGVGKKTYFLEPSRPSPLNTSKIVLDTDGIKSLSPVGEVGNSTILPSSKSLDSELLHGDEFEQKSRPLFMDINVILDDALPTVLSTETPSTTTILNDHHATTARSIDENHSILDPLRPDPNHQPVRKTSSYGLNKDSKSIWLLDEEEYENSEESDDYEVVDVSQSSRLPVTGVSVTSDDELNGKEYSSNFEEEYEIDPDDDAILVIGHLSTLSPVISASERQDDTESLTTQFDKKENNPAQIRLNEWPVQIGLQARSKSSFATKPVESLTENLNKQKMTSLAEDSNSQQLKNSQTKFNENHHSNGIASYAEANLSFDESNGNGNSDHVSFRPHIRFQFMHSPVVKTVQPETSMKLTEIEMKNHYGNPNGGKPIKSVTTTSEPEKSNHYISPQEERKQEASPTTEPDEAFYYLNSEEETDHDISLDYPDEEESRKPMAAETNTPETVVGQSPSSYGRPPYFISSSVAPLQQRMDSDNDFELMKPIELVENRMDINPNNGITFVDGGIQPMVLLPFPADHILFNQPALVVQPLMATTVHPVSETETPKKDTFIVNSNHTLPSTQLQNSGSSISSKGTTKAPYISVKLEPEEKDLKGLMDEKPHIGYSVQEKPKLSDDIKPHQMKMSNIKIHEDPILPAIHHDELPSPKTTSSPTRIQPGTLSQPTTPMAVSNHHADEIIVISNPRPFVQTAYVTRSSNKAGSGPYFVSSVEPSYRRNSYSEEEDMTKPLIEYNRSSAAKRDEGITDRSNSSASAGRPPYFVTNSSPTPLHPMKLNGPTPKPIRNIKIEDENSDRSLLSLSSHALLRPTSSETRTFTKEQFTTTQIPVEKSVGRQFDNFDISFGPVRPTLPYILTRLNAAHPIQPFYPSSTASNVTERILDIDLPTEEGMKLTSESLPNPIGISNKNNVFVVPKQTGNYTARTPVHSSTVPTFLSTSKPGSSKRKNQLETTTGTIVNHNMGSFVVTSNPIRSSIQPKYTYRPATVATVLTTKEPDLVKSIKLRGNDHKFDINYSAQEEAESTAVVENPIGISNKDNVFVVPKTVKGIIQLPIRSSTLPTDTLMKRQHPSMNGEQQSSTLRPFERIVSHQMGSFVVTYGPKSVQHIPNAATRETIVPTEIPEMVIRSPAKPAGLAQPPYFATNSTYELIGSSKRKMGKSERIIRNRTGNSDVSRIEFMTQSTLIGQLPAGQLTSRSNTNSRKQQQSSRPLQHPKGRSRNRSVVSASPRPSTLNLTSAPSNRKE